MLSFVDDIILSESSCYLMYDNIVVNLMRSKDCQLMKTEVSCTVG